MTTSLSWVGIHFHHLMGGEGDPYLLVMQLRFDTRERLGAYLRALQAVVDRHDILRTAVVWEGLPEPVQVVWRHAVVPVEEVDMGGSEGDVAAGMYEQFTPRYYRIDVCQAPILRIWTAHDPQQDQWLMLQFLHHLIGDYQTMTLIHEEIEAYLLGKEAALPAPIPYRNMVAQARLGVSAEEQERFFREMLGEVSEPTLPFGLSDVHQDGEAITESRRMLPQELNDRLRAQARRLGVSLASLCHLAWGQVVARSSGSEQVVFGTVLFGRMQGGEGADRSVGLFINTLPFRMNLDGAATEVAALQTHTRLADLLMHEHASLALAQQCSGVAAATPLFSAILNYRHNPGHETPVDLVNGTHPIAKIELLKNKIRNNYPLTLSVEDYGQTLGLTALVVRPLSPERICGYMQQALESLVTTLETAPETPVRELEILPPEERRLLLEEWNATETEYPSHQSVHQLFEEQVRKSPDAVAVVCGDESLSYAELNEQANRLAHYLIGLGVKPDDRVGICVERSLGMVVGLLGILKSGGAYVPLDPAYPTERLRQVLADAAPKILLSDAAGREAVGNNGLKKVTALDIDIRSDFSALPFSNPEPKYLGLTPRHFAYIMYTSGSTGTPKGVMVQHHSACNQLIAIINSYGLRRHDRILQFASPSSDGSLEEIFGALLNGAVLVLRTDVWLASIAEFDRQCIYHNITVTSLPAAFWANLAITWSDASISLTLRKIIVGYEAISTYALKLWFESEKQKPLLLNSYGPTETTINATTQEIEPCSTWSSIGRPMANNKIYVLDEYGHPVPMGVVGEIYIGGAGGTFGYLNRPELTSERFIPDPFSPVGGLRMYKTGDLARYLPDGNIEFLGRNDYQVKIRGFRIELGEIEARLGEHPLVRQAVVVAREDAPGEKRLVAYVIPTAPEQRQEESLESSLIGTTNLAAALRTHLAGCLPEYMVPVAFVHMNELQLTPNGKIDRKKLPVPDIAAFVRQAYEAPQYEMEHALAELWQELLNVERVGRHDNFFELGGHSLLAVQLMVRVRQVLGVELSMVTLFAKPTIAQLAQIIAESSANDNFHSFPPLTKISRHARLPLSFAQQRLWFLAQMEDVSVTYHIPAALHLRWDLDRAALRKSLDALMARHEALRSVFVAVEGEPHIELLPEEMGLPLIEHDLRDEPDAWEQLTQLSKEEARTPFDLSRGPLIRARLIRMGEQEYVFLLTQHHIVSDGASLGVFVRELSVLYRAFQEQRPDPLPPLAIQYPDYAAWQREWLSGERLQRQSDYWRQALADAPTLLELPTDRPRPQRQSFAGAYVSIRIDGKLTKALKQLSAQQGTTLFMTLLAAWAAVLSRLSGQDDVIIGTPSANRGRKETEGLIGFFVNTLAMRINLGNEPTVTELLAEVRAATLAAQDHQDLPFEQLVEIVQPPRRLNHTPLFQVLFAWDSNEKILPEFPEVSSEPLGAGYSFAKYDLRLDLHEKDDVILGGMNYATALFDEATIKRHCGYLLEMLKAMVVNVEQPVVEINLLPPEERRLLLEEWNATEAEYASQLCIHELFEEQVRKSPDAVAVVCGDELLSYAGLNEQANQLAHYLIGLGVKPDDRVGICVERSLGMVVGLLGILKSGGAYVPLDPAYPTERLRQVLADAAPKILLSDAAGREALGEESYSWLTVVELDSDPAVWEGEPVTDPDPQQLGLRSDNLAYVIYTSGSTGIPKGVMVEHRSVTNFHLAMMQTIYEPDSSQLHIGWNAPFSFDMSIKGFAQLLSGHCLVMIPQQVRATGEALLVFLQREAIDAFDTTPSQLKSMIAEGFLEQNTHNSCSVLIGGEAVDTTMWLQLKNSGSIKFYNMYGPTECTVDATIGAVIDQDEIPHIGHAVANTRIYLLDEYGEPVPLGAVGELYVGGAGVARGYLKRPELTAERFLADGFSPEGGARMYKTGDLARYLPDGNIEFLGRNDNQVKIRGFRIELGEIEARLGEHPLVRQAVVVAREEAGGEKRLMAYVVPASEAEDGELAGTLRGHLAARLPEYMVPAAYVRLEQLPLTPNGKLDRKALPAPEQDAYVRGWYEAPVGEVEETLARLWQELLGVERVGRHDNFFELGGHSLLAVQLIVRVRQTLQVEMPITTLFLKPTLAQIAEVVMEMSARGDSQILPPITVVSRESALPLSFSQQRLWFLAQMEDISVTYHIPAALRLIGVFDRLALRQSLDAIFARHEALRSVFVAVEGEPHIELLPEEMGLPLIEHDLRDESDAWEQLTQLSKEEARTPFDLSRGPLIRARLIRMGEQEYVFLLTQHHIVSDGAS